MIQRACARIKVGVATKSRNGPSRPGHCASSLRRGAMWLSEPRKLPTVNSLCPRTNRAADSSPRSEVELPSFQDLARLSPLPIVDLRRIAPPEDGLLVPAPEVCRRNFEKSDVCRKHYEMLAAGRTLPNLVQCPYGFASSVVHVS